MQLHLTTKEYIAKKFKTHFGAGLTPLRRSMGFTLIETFVAVTILMIVIVGPLGLAQRSISSASLTKEKLTAYYLAQDAIEYIRNARDNNSLTGGSWQAFLDTVVTNKCEGAFGEEPKCIIDTFQPPSSSLAVIKCDSWDDCTPLTYNTVTNVYRYGAGANWAPSPFKRGVRITRLFDDSGNSNEISIKVVVSWTSQNFGYEEVVLRDTLLNW